jgi:LPXTG-motif cell wall-anchored protein
MFDNTDDIEMSTPEEPLPEDNGEDGGGGNRVFLIAIGVLGAIFILSLIVFAVIALINVPQRTAQRNTQVAQINAQNTATALSFTQTAEPALWTPVATLTVSIPKEAETATPTIESTSTTAAISPAEEATVTPVLAAPAAEDLTATVTMSALLTQVAQAQQTVIPTLAATIGAPAVAAAATELPSTGFADEVGIPGLIGLSVLLIVVIFLVRRLRLSTGR